MTLTIKRFDDSWCRLSIHLEKVFVFVIIKYTVTVGDCRPIVLILHFVFHNLLIDFLICLVSTRTSRQVFSRLYKVFHIRVTQ